MRKNIFTILLIITVSLGISAQETALQKAPKQYSFEFGYRQLFAQSHFANSSSHGYGMLLDYAWQLSGLDGTKNKSFISVPIGYTVMMADNVVSNNIHMLNYGWTVRHELSRNKKVIPFVGYGLLLNNMRQTGIDGSLFGHQTQFDLGINFKTKTRLQYFAKIEYSYTSYPQFNDPERSRLHFADLRIGLRY